MGSGFVIHEFFYFFNLSFPFLYQECVLANASRQKKIPPSVYVRFMLGAQWKRMMIFLSKFH